MYTSKVLCVCSAYAVLPMDIERRLDKFCVIENVMLPIGNL